MPNAMQFNGSVFRLTFRCMAPRSPIPFRSHLRTIRETGSLSLAPVYSHRATKAVQISCVPLQLLLFCFCCFLLLSNHVNIRRSPEQFPLDAFDGEVTVLCIHRVVFVFHLANKIENLLARLVVPRAFFQECHDGGALRHGLSNPTHFGRGIVLTSEHLFRHELLGTNSCRHFAGDNIASKTKVHHLRLAIVKDNILRLDVTMDKSHLGHNLHSGRQLFNNATNEVDIELLLGERAHEFIELVAIAESLKRANKNVVPRARCFLLLNFVVHVLNFGLYKEQ